MEVCVCVLAARGKRHAWTSSNLCTVFRWTWMSGLPFFCSPAISSSTNGQAYDHDEEGEEGNGCESVAWLARTLKPLSPHSLSLLTDTSEALRAEPPAGSSRPLHLIQ